MASPGSMVFLCSALRIQEDFGNSSVQSVELNDARPIHTMQNQRCGSRDVSPKGHKYRSRLLSELSLLHSPEKPQSSAPLTSSIYHSMNNNRNSNSNSENNQYSNSDYYNYVYNLPLSQYAQLVQDEARGRVWQRPQQTPPPQPTRLAVIVGYGPGNKPIYSTYHATPTFPINGPGAGR